MINALVSFAPLAIYMPSLEMILVFLFAASLPVLFVIWMRGWLSSVKDEHPDEVIAAQAKADEEHRKQSGHQHPHSGAHA